MTTRSKFALSAAMAVLAGAGAGLRRGRKTAGRSGFLAAAALMLTGGVLAAPTMTSAAEVYGSAEYLTIRPCTQPVGTACVIGGPSNFILKGGFSQVVGDTLDNGSSSLSSVSSSYGADLLPITGLFSGSSGSTRVSANLTAFRSYTYVGPSAIDLTLAGNFHFITSDGGGALSQEQAGEGLGYADVFVSRMDFVTDLAAQLAAQANSPNAILFCNSCGTRLAEEILSSVGTTPYGQLFHNDINLPFNLTFLVNPGDQFIVGEQLHVAANRGGFIDATHTLTLHVDPTASFLAGTHDLVDPTVLANSLTSDIGVVPEPSSWALLLLGFGGLGVMLRGRRRAAVGAT